MTNALSDKELEKLLKFVGYGKLNADVWFIGMEEAGGGEKNIRSRLEFKDVVVDCAEAHETLGISKHHRGKKVIQRTWGGMCSVMLRLEGLETDRESVRNYQAYCLGSSHGSTLLCELMPIPKPSIGSWGYEKLIPQFASRDEYYQVVKPCRVKHLQRLLREHRPKIVIGYGKKYWTYYKELFPDLKFASSGQFLTAETEDMVVVLTDHFTARTMNGDLKFKITDNILKKKPLISQE